jgi:anti-sigma factor RsiW
MSCSAYGELLSAYIEDELSKKEDRLLVHHLEKCPASEEELSRYQLQRERVVSLRAAYFAPLPQRELTETVMAQI